MKWENVDKIVFPCVILKFTVQMIVQEEKEKQT